MFQQTSMINLFNQYDLSHYSSLKDGRVENIDVDDKGAYSDRKKFMDMGSWAPKILPVHKFVHSTCSDRFFLGIWTPPY